MPPATREHDRLAEKDGPLSTWRRFGPYVSERAWGTVREDYSPDGNAWGYFPHSQARSKAYRWGEDGLAAICDRYQILCFAFAFWNERDPILKERLFGVVPSEGNHGEDVKEYYFYLDNLPSHSYMKWLYKYPQREFPYEQLVRENQALKGQGPEYELLDTGIFDDDRYFDIEVEYAKDNAEDIAVRVRAHNRGPEAAPLHILPHLWFRNSWSWGTGAEGQPRIVPGASGQAFVSLTADEADLAPPKQLPFQYKLGLRHLFGPAGMERALFTDNETNAEACYGPGAISRSPFTKDAFHRRIIHGEDATNPADEGTKAALHYRSMVPALGSVELCFRFSNRIHEDPIATVPALIEKRRAEADEFYASIHAPLATEDEKLVQRQAFAGMLWTKQIYLFDVNVWLDGDRADWPPPESRKQIRNQHWRHVNSMRIMSMPDKWEYPWFAAWDLAFHCIPFAAIDPEFAKEQMWLLLFEQFQHPSGQIPAYEWEFSDLNPPVQAWAVWRIYNMDRLRTGRADRLFLEKCFHKLLINFAWWVNKVDREGNNVFEGGFLGLDNITVIDRSEKLPHGAVLEQSDATGWMGMLCQQLMRISLELARENKAYEALATKFFQHYIYVGAAMKRMGGRNYQLFDEADGFFYDVLRFPDGAFEKFRVRSLVGLVPLYAIERLEEKWMAPFKEFTEGLIWFVRNKSHVVQNVCYPLNRDGATTHVLAIVDPDQTRRLLDRVFDPDEFWSEFGLRSMSRVHDREPFHFGERTVRYEPAEAEAKIKGGNSNWRGPIWFPTSFLMIEALRKLGTAYGPTFKVRVGGPNGEEKPLWDAAKTMADRMIAIFTRGADGRRPCHGRREKFQTDPHWRDLILFYEYFHGDTGEGLGASHQTGWTGLVASLIDEWRKPPQGTSR
jgi:Glycosyl hydrolase family 63 C-terminal domain